MRGTPRWARFLGVSALPAMMAAAAPAGAAGPGSSSVAGGAANPASAPPGAKAEGALAGGRVTLLTTGKTVPLPPLVVDGCAGIGEGALRARVAARVPAARKAPLPRSVTVVCKHGRVRLVTANADWRLERRLKPSDGKAHLDQVAGAVVDILAAWPPGPRATPDTPDTYRLYWEIEGGARWGDLERPRLDGRLSISGGLDLLPMWGGLVSGGLTLEGTQGTATRRGGKVRVRSNHGGIVGAVDWPATGPAAFRVRLEALLGWWVLDNRSDGDLPLANRESGLGGQLAGTAGAVWRFSPFSLFLGLRGSYSITEAEGIVDGDDRIYARGIGIGPTLALRLTP